MKTSDYLQKLRLLGWRLVAPDEASRNEAFRKEFENDFRIPSSPNHISQAAMHLGFVEDWARSGFPQVIVESKLFASLCATRIPSDLVPELGLPWECFVVRIPDDLEIAASIQFNDGRMARPSFLACIPLGNGDYLLEVRPAEPGMALGVPFRSLSCLLRPDEGLGWCDFEGVPSCRHELLKNQTAALQRAFVGCVMELMSRPETRGHAKVFGKRPDGRRASSPKSYTFVLTRPVVVDVREHIKATLSGKAQRGRKTAFVQRLIPGHWRNQPCGPGRADRKFIHIEPYWRGPEDAPIAVREHVLKGDKGGSFDRESGAAE